MESSKYIKFDLNIKTLSPLFIGQDQGSELSPYTDYIQTGNDLIIIDQNKLINELSKDRDLIDKFTEQVKAKVVNNRSEFDLKSFLESNFNQDIDYFEKERFTIKDDTKRNHIRRFINSSGRPFIPGSTIKGAIMTSIIYDWMINNDDGKKLTDDLILKITELWNANKEAILKYNENEIKLAEVKKRLKEFKNKLHGQEAERLKNERGNLEKSLKEEKKVIYKYKDEINKFSELKFLSYMNDKAKIFQTRFLQISDSKFYNPSSKGILKLERIKITDSSSVSTQWSEVINENEENGFEIRIAFSELLKELNFLNNGDISTVYKILNKFSKDCVENEIENLKEIKNNDELTSSLTGYYNNLINIIEKSNNKYALLRMGGGKTYFDNSIGLIIKRKNPEAFTALRYIFNIGFNPTSKQITKQFFPITRTLEFAFNDLTLPIGWTLLFNNKISDNLNSEIDKLFGQRNNEVKTDQGKTIKDENNKDPFAKLSEKFKVTNKK